MTALQYSTNAMHQADQTGIGIELNFIDQTSFWSDMTDSVFFFLQPQFSISNIRIGVKKENAGLVNT